jgi:hypothetical protein
VKRKGNKKKKQLIEEELRHKLKEKAAKEKLKSKEKEKKTLRTF